MIRTLIDTIGFDVAIITDKHYQRYTKELGHASHIFKLTEMEIKNVEKHEILVHIKSENLKVIILLCSTKTSLSILMIAKQLYQRLFDHFIWITIHVGLPFTAIELPKYLILINSRFYLENTSNCFQFRGCCSR